MNEKEDSVLPFPNMGEKNESQEPYLLQTFEQYKGYERFSFVRNYIRPYLDQATAVLDIGCAKGEFISFMKEVAPDVLYTGLEYSRELIDLARKEESLAGVNVVEGDARDFDLNQQFDVVLMQGVLSIFDQYEKPLQTMMRHVMPGGVGVVFGMFNSFDVDVIMRYRNNAAGKIDWESGLNNFSLKRVHEYLCQFTQDIRVIPFNLSIDLTTSAEKPIRSYTLKTLERGRIILNGTGMLTDIYLIIIKKSA